MSETLQKIFSVVKIVVKPFNSHLCTNLEKYKNDKGNKINQWL